MQLPKYKKKKRVKLKVCQEPGCGKQFWGHPIAKYCPEHRDIKNRQKQKKEYESVETNNMVFRHNFANAIQFDFKCCLEGCEKEFPIDIFPKLFVYPRFCEEHRNPYKRQNFLRLTKKEKSGT